MKTVLALLTLFSTSLVAGEWTAPLEIKDVSVTANEGYFSGKAQLRVTFEQNPITSLCPAPKQNLVVYDPSGGPDSWMDTWLSMLLTAQAQGKRVRIYVHSCRRDQIPLMYGVKVIKN
ncbi:hypothetical protein VISI1226_21634 [Vibrio sinaloensis DSM 21326]|uniref:Uncharacterized protein n=1 Tax=Vibrio sinaloensis DSM 21326 TaxID=945550 RepID=E8MBP7_PHOS4|nr:hypothetical protein [Vibrio sinaloensis]EGA68633.1 hypothetical protein VISI1226_21634 [Vibrio sinaloensis DSM 21326]